MGFQLKLDSDYKRTVLEGLQLNDLKTSTLRTTMWPFVLEGLQLNDLKTKETTFEELIKVLEGLQLNDLKTTFDYDSHK